MESIGIYSMLFAYLFIGGVVVVTALGLIPAALIWGILRMLHIRMDRAAILAGVCVGLVWAIACLSGEYPRFGDSPAGLIAPSAEQRAIANAPLAIAVLLLWPFECWVAARLLGRPKPRE